MLTVYDHVIPVPRLRNERPANLYLMNRADLHSAFTKINLWKQTQFSKIVYIDADVVAYRAPDELFSIPHPFSAAPDIGWPDLFNSGVMVLTPNMGDYYALVAMAERGISFDGADQGLLNMHFGKNYNRISFTYNVTPSAHYQYLPAYHITESPTKTLSHCNPIIRRAYT
ncbi:Glycogenin-1 like protein [Verticillium longisporum]|uniref:glycogenin glucosyltransferase n=1 Tax=Verticillium longisporum TaxID=100787 RepID=A0A8I2YZK9_VERLO|nr:Glycogenin-1 like protein [Verticillium longisporum]